MISLRNNNVNIELNAAYFSEGISSILKDRVVLLNLYLQNPHAHHVIQL